VVPICPSCEQENPEGFRFCGACGAPLAVEALARREERKVVTVLFCDLVGSTAQAERMDPEDVRAMLSYYHGRVREELEHFGGTVEKFIGDAVVALFGAPVAHEDDPERAVRAALAIREWVAGEPDLHVRIAVNTGEALVALGARPAEGEGMASGDVVNTAARLQSAAPVDGILAGEQTYRATERVIEYRAAEPVTAKGKAEPIPVWEVVQARSWFGVDLARPSRPLVGREREVELLVAAFARVCEERTAQLVTVVGVPGIGKSRLLAELFAAIDRGDRLVTWRQGRSLPYGEGVSFWALGEMLKAQAGILETDAPADAARKLDETVVRLLPDEAEARWVESHLHPLAGLTSDDDAAADRRGEAFAAWRRFFEALAEQRPLVLVFEDLHCADDGLLDFVDQLVDWLTDVPILVVASARPELLARRPAWGGGKANATTVSLSPLSDEETARLVHGLLERSVLPADFQAALLERSGGNPLYAEEFVRMFAERGGADLELPGSVQGIIAARLDGLSPEDKGMLQDAAVIGKVFWSGALAAIGGTERFAVEERLHALERRELVRRARRSAVAGESEYAFRHVLVRDVAYGTIPRAARAERHRGAAEWIESLGRPDDHGDLLAHHYLSALELARAAGVDAGVLAASAATALQRAGDRAFALNAFASAARFYDEALALGVTGQARPHTLFRLGAALHLAADERRIEVLEQAREELLASGDPEAAAEASALLANVWWTRGNHTNHREELERAQELVHGRVATAAGARVLAQAARSAMLAGEDEKAIRMGRKALAMAEELGLDELVPSALQSIGIGRAHSGDAGGIADVERAVATAMAANNPDAGRAYNNLAELLADQGELRRAHELWLEGKTVAERLGNASVQRYIDGMLIGSAYASGRWDECLAAAQSFIAECAAGSPHYLEHSAQADRARILLARDDPGEAAAATIRAIALAREANDAQALLPALVLQVDIYRKLGRDDEARAAAEEALSRLRRGMVQGMQTTVALALAADQLKLHDETRAVLTSLPPTPWTATACATLDGKLERVANVLRGFGDLPREAEVRLRFAAVLVTAERGREADEQLDSALEFYRSVAATRYIREAEALVAATA
jgi:predicted ATPase/class 3 adenylate cyclase